MDFRCNAMFNRCIERVASSVLDTNTMSIQRVMESVPHDDVITIAKPMIATCSAMTNQ